MRALSVLLLACAIPVIALAQAPERGNESGQVVSLPSKGSGLLPVKPREKDYISSHACRECHPDRHASWHRSYHRTMTQPATKENVLGQFDGTVINSGGLSYRVWQRGEEYWADMPDPDIMMYVIQGGRRVGKDKYRVRGRSGVREIHLRDIPRVQRQVLMTTGSHRYQTYWVASQRHPGTLQTLPLVYLPSDQRWIPREEAFMRAPDDDRMITQWNHHCIQCHSTGPIPAPYEETTTDSSGRRVISESGFKTRVGELGIACEACHGPGQQHAKLTTAESIVNPAILDHRRSSQICGQCHGVYIRLEEYGMRFAKEGVLYRPGDDLHKVRYYIRFPGEDATEQQRIEFEKNPDFYRERWWGDGTVLAAGREYTALRETACFQRGELSCLSCHSMHDSDPNDQLQPSMRTSAACVQCHDEPQYTSQVTRHTFHAADSTGSNCLNCHMPHTTYALFTAIRNHQIQSPELTRSTRHGVPNACNLCHLDKTLGWTQQHLAAWYGHDVQNLTAEQQQVSAAMLWLLKGNAAQRAIVAWHLGWSPAQQISGADWLAPLAAQLLDDPYGVVRYVAGQRLRTLSGFEDFTYDFLAPRDQLLSAERRAVERWRNRARPVHPRQGLGGLFDAQGRLDMNHVQQLVDQRDDRPVAIKE